MDEIRSSTPGTKHRSKNDQSPQFLPASSTDTGAERGAGGPRWLRLYGEPTRRATPVSADLSLQAEEVFQPLRDWIDRRPNAFTMKLKYEALPGTRMWDYSFFKQYAPNAIVSDGRPDQPGDRFWWEGDGGQVSIRCSKPPDTGRWDCISTRGKPAHRPKRYSSVERPP
jgi:hypothetical protein